MQEARIFSRVARASITGLISGLISGLVGSMGLVACGGAKNDMPPPIQEVGVVTLHAQPVTITTELPGRSVAYRIADVRPQVSGVILKRMFTEGSEVKAGQPLYLIDPAPFQANLESAQASLARAEATLVAAKLLAERYQPLVEAHAVSRQDYDNAVASQGQAQADVASAKASVDSARINLVYTKVLSPIAGHSGRSSVTEGALVAANQATALVTVQQLDPIYVDATQPSTLLLRLQRELASGQLKRAGDSQAQVQLTLEDGSAYPQAGELQFAEVTVDAGTGSVTLRAVYPNPQKILLPGMFVREHIDEGVNDQALLVPQQAVTHNQRGEATALVVDANEQVVLHVLKTERAIGDQWLVSEGVAAGDRLIVEGLQDARPGAKVQAHEVVLDSQQASPGTTPASQPSAGGASDSQAAQKQ